MDSRPDYNFWRKFAELPLWQVAAMMQNMDPNALEDMADRNGDGPDLTAEIEMLTGAVRLQLIQCRDFNASARASQQKVVTASAIIWLRGHGYPEVAAGLEAGSTGGDKKNKRWTPELIEEAREFRSRNTAAATADKYGVSEARIRQKLTQPKKPARGSSVFNQGSPQTRK